ncbi:MAG: response regulator, partial [Alphaproteobacteria bacterium]
METESVRILLVEDDPGDVALATTLLREIRTPRYRVTVSASLSEALRKLSHGIFDVVLLDLTLPDSRSMDTVRAIVQAAPEVAVIVHT